MAKHQTSTALALFERLPPATRRKLALTEVRALTGAITIKDRIHAYFAQDAQARKVLRHYKREHGYCGGLPWCLAYTGEEASMCSSCLQDARNQRAGVTRYKRRKSAYGTIRETERAQEKAERDRLKGAAR